MKRLSTHLLAIVVFTLIISVASAQNCKSVKETKDPFSGEEVKRAKLNIGPPILGWKLILDQKGDKYYLGMIIVMPGDKRHIFAKGDKIMIKLENDKIIESEMIQDYKPTASIAGTRVISSWYFNTEIGFKNMKRLSRSPISHLKFTVDGADITLRDIKTRQTNKIMDAADCIISEPSES